MQRSKPWGISGNSWLFGGIGYAATGSGYLNDMWQYSPSTGDRIAVKGAAGVPAVGSYATKGVAETANVQGGCAYQVKWYSGGLFWMFSGNGEDLNGNVGDLNHLWELTPVT